MLGADLGSSMPRSPPVRRGRPGQRLAAAGHEGAARAATRAAAAGSGMPGRRPRADLQVVAGVFGHMGGEAAGLAQGASCEMDLLDPRVWPGWRCGGGGISGRRGGGLGGCDVIPICRSSAAARWWSGCCLGGGSSVADRCRWTWRLEAEDPRRNHCPRVGQDWRRRRPRVPLTFLEASPRDLLLIPWSCLRRETSDPWIGRLNVFLLVGGIVSELASTWAPVNVWLMSRLAWGCCGQFGNDEASSGAWVAAWDLLVGHLRVRWVLLCFTVPL